MNSNIVKLRHPVKVSGDSTMVVEVVLITPEVASQWLKANQHNRPVSRAHVAFLAGELRRSNWQLNGQGIVISEDEDVLDGQHRLLAIIEAGIPMRTLVIYGISREAFKTMDTGKRRSGSDALALAFPDAQAGMTKTVAAAVNWCVRMEASFFGRESTLKMSNTGVLQYVVKHASLWSCAETIHGYPMDARPLSVGCGTALYEVFARKDAELAADYIRKLYTGELLMKDEPEFLLRQMLIKDAQRLQSYPAVARMRMAVKAWNLRRRGLDAASKQLIAIHPAETSKLVVL